MAGFTTPPSRTVRGVLAPTVWLPEKSQVAVRLAWFSEQLPMAVLLAVRIAELLSLPNPVPDGNVIVMLLF